VGTSFVIGNTVTPVPFPLFYPPARLISPFQAVYSQPLRVSSVRERFLRAWIALLLFVARKRLNFYGKTPVLSLGVGNGAHYSFLPYG
jgi:hypothetical protein